MTVGQRIIIKKGGYMSKELIAFTVEKVYTLGVTSIKNELKRIHQLGLLPTLINELSRKDINLAKQLIQYLKQRGIQ